MRARAVTRLAVVFALGVWCIDVAAQERGRGAAGAPAATPRSVAPLDLTGNWVAIITEDWR